MGVLPHQTPAAFDCASGNKHSKTALVKVRTRGCLQVKHSVSIHCVKHTKSKHCVQTITKYNQWLNFYRRRALGNSPRPTLSIYCPEVRKYLLVWFAILPSSKWEHSSCCRRQFRSNIVIQSAVLTLCFVTSGQTVLLQTRCLDYYSIKSIPKPYRRCAFGNSPRPTL